MWRKKLRKFIPSDLHRFFLDPDPDGDDESRQFGFEAKTVELRAEIPSQLAPNDQEYLLYLWNSLTRREQEVVALVCLHHRNYEIAQILGIAPSTVKWYLEEILKKLNMPDRQAIRYAFQGWGFQLWWMNRHILPVQNPSTP